MKSSIPSRACRRVLFLWCVFMLAVPAGAAWAGPVKGTIRPVITGDGGMVHGAGLSAVKAPGDSLLLMGPDGSGAPYVGNFQIGLTEPAWHGWTHTDNTENPLNRWHVSDYMAGNLGGHGVGNLAAWCGEDYPACSVSDTAGGYGNDYNEILSWTATVADPGAPCTASLGARLNYDVEPGYDYVYLVAYTAGDVSQELAAYTGTSLDVVVGASFTWQPGDYLGDTGDRIKLAFLVRSDGAWSDEDCIWPTRGACQLDDVTVTADNGVTDTFDDFQAGLGNWTAEIQPGVGDFTQIWSGLEDADPCRTNYSPQVAFIDDGVVVPGVGPTYCINWCYGPNGYIVNNTGGRLGEAYHLDNSIQSPVMAWPQGQYNGAQLDFTVYMHEDLATGSAGIFPTWDVRSTASTDPADIALESWHGRSFVYYGGPEYRRFENDVSDLLAPEATYVQVRLQVLEVGWIWGWDGYDGTPAPYFDNVRLMASTSAGPFMSAREIDLAQDAFPASGVLDETDPGTNSVRFDMARNIAPAEDSRNDPGDSLVVAIRPARSGAVLAGMPRMYYRVRPNPDFDPYRTAGLPLEGYVEGDSLVLGGGTVDPGRFAFDLPDTGFLFPGDVIHYCFQATEDLAGDLRTAILPADTTGFSDFSDRSYYDQRFTMRALPAMRSYGGSVFYYPDLLLWYDGPWNQGLDEWLTSLRELMLDTGWDFDLYRTQGASSGVGNGLGGRATVAQVSPYAVILYDCGDYSANTLGAGDFAGDPSVDVQLLDAWLDLPDKGLYLAGNNLVSDVNYLIPEGQAFVQDRMGVTVVTSLIRPLISNQTSPRVQVIAGNPRFPQRTWRVFGGCPTVPALDGVTALPEAVRIAEYLDPVASPGVYPYAAATWKTDAVSGSKVLSTPFAFDRIWDDGDDAGPIAMRTQWLADVLHAFGLTWYWIPSGMDVPGPDDLTAAAAPNPFNPRVTISYRAPRDGELAVRIYDLQGRLVRELPAGRVVPGPGAMIWDGTDGAGSPAASGVYFYEVLQGPQTARGKIALIR